MAKKNTNSSAVSNLSNQKMKRKMIALESKSSMRNEKIKSLKGTSKTNFQKLIDMELSGSSATAEDLEIERRLAKKLGVKGGILGGIDDGMNMLLDGLQGCDNSSNEAHMIVHDDRDQEVEGDHVEIMLAEDNKKKKRHKRKKNATDSNRQEENNVLGAEADVLEQHGASDTVEVHEEVPREDSMDTGVKYVPPHLRACLGGGSEQHSDIRRRVRGLLNRLSESNVESITGEMAAIFQSIGRSVACHIIGEEVVASCSVGPRGNEQYAAVFAAFVAGMACLVGIDFSARLLVHLAKSFQGEYHMDDGLSLRNLTLLLSYLCIFGVCSSDLVYDLLSMLSKRLNELDVSIILALLQCCGMKLRSDDPIAMKEFILGIQNRVNELKVPNNKSDADSKQNMDSKRMEFMLETICDIKNNKKKSKEDSSLHTRVKKWLQKLRSDDILLRGLGWSKLLDPEKKGQWWLSGEVTPAEANVEDVAGTTNKDLLESQKLVHLAASQRMNTDVRRAIFCIIMSAEDYVDCFEKILKLDLSGKQDREVMRVLVDCCLQEKMFNKYYTVLASKLCSHDKNNKFTLQYCLWDHFKELDSMELQRSMNLARFTAEMVSSFTMSLSILKAADLASPVQLTPRRILHFRMLFEALLRSPDDRVQDVFSRLAGSPDLEELRESIHFFVKRYVVVGDEAEAFAEKYKVAKRALGSSSGRGGFM